jgi:hypothetical protein
VRAARDGACFGARFEGFCAALFVGFVAVSPASARARGFRAALFAGFRAALFVGFAGFRGALFAGFADEAPRFGGDTGAVFGARLCSSSR